MHTRIQHCTELYSYLAGGLGGRGVPFQLLQPCERRLARQLALQVGLALSDFTFGSLWLLEGGSVDVGNLGLGTRWRLISYNLLSL